MTLLQIIRLHVYGSGPVSFASILAYVHKQFSPATQDFQVANALTDLIRSGDVALYDDGVSFTADKPR